MVICTYKHDTDSNFFFLGNSLSDFDDDKRDLSDIISSSKESECCIGGVDYVTLVGVISYHLLPC